MIISVAIKRKSDDRLWVGGDRCERHCDIIRRIVKGGHADRVGSDFVQGFVTDEGQFVNRREAYCIALNCHQFGNAHTSIPQLTSEDLW